MLESFRLCACSCVFCEIPLWLIIRTFFKFLIIIRVSVMFEIPIFKSEQWLSLRLDIKICFFTTLDPKVEVLRLESRLQRSASVQLRRQIDHDC